MGVVVDKSTLYAVVLAYDDVKHDFSAVVPAKAGTHTRGPLSGVAQWST